MKQRKRIKPKRTFADRIDDAVFAVFPGWGQKRRQYRRKDRVSKQMTEFALDRVGRSKLSAYDAADNDRFRGEKWLASKLSQNTIIDDELETLQDRAEDLYRNDAYASSAINGRVTHVVGTGYTLQSRVTGKDGATAGDREIQLRKQFETVHAKWAKQQKLASKQRMFQRCKAIYGEGLLVLSDTGAADKPVPLDVQVISPKRLTTPDSQTVIRTVRGRESKVELSSVEFNAIRQGIRYDSNDVATHFYIRTSLPNDATDMRREWREYPADRVFHSFEEIFPGQIRGIPWLTPAMADLKDLKDFKEAHLISEQIAACFSAFITKDDAYGAADNNSTDTSADGARLEEVEPGIIQYLNPGEDVKLSDPNRPGGTFGPFMEWFLRTVSAAISYPYELLAKDYSRTTYSSGRLSLVDGRITFGCWQKQDTDAWMWVYGRFADECVMVGAVDIQPAEYLDERDRFIAHYWQPDGWPWIDPVKEVKADTDAIEAGLGTKTRSLASRGEDFDETQETRYQEKASELELQARLLKRQRELEEEYKVDLAPDAESKEPETSNEEVTVA